MKFEILIEVANKSQIQITHATDFGFQGTNQPYLQQILYFYSLTMLFRKIFSNITICTFCVNQNINIYVVNTNHC